MGIVIGIDVGTTTTKVIAVDTASSWRVAAYREYKLAEPQPRWQVQNPRMVLDALDCALAEVVGASAGRAIAVIGVGSAMHGLVGLGAPLRPATDISTWADTRPHGEAAELRGAGAGRASNVIGVGSGMHGLVGLGDKLRPVTDIITWAVTRAHAEAAELRAAGRGKELLHLSGTPVHPMSPLVKLMWFSRHDTATASRVHRWVGLKDLVLLHLTGRLVTELSTASASG